MMRGSPRVLLAIGGSGPSPVERAPWDRLRQILRNNGMLLSAIGVGLILRALLAGSAWGVTDSDQVAGMLMAHAAAHGHYYTFFWGANYGGTLITFLEAPLVWLFGLHLTTFRVVDVVLALVDTLLLRAVAGRMLSRRAAAVAPALFWLFPPAWVHWSLQEYVFWLGGIGVALGTAWFSSRWAEERRDRWLCGAGICLGLSFWTYPLLLCLAGPPAAAVLWALRRNAAEMVKFFAAAAGGVLPWLYTNLTTDFESLHRTLTSAEAASGRLTDSVTRVLPTALLLSTRVGISPRRAELVGVVVMAAAAGTFAWHAVGIRKAVSPARGDPKGSTRHLALALSSAAILLWPLLLTATGVPVPASSYRYGFIILPALALLVADGLDRIRLGTMSVVAAALITFVGAAQATDNFGAAPAWDPQLRPVAAYLTSEGRTRVFAGYWVSYVLTLASDRRVVASPVSVVRDPLDATLVDAAPRSTYVVQDGNGLDSSLKGWVLRHRAGRRTVIGAYAIYEFDSRLTPSEIGLVGLL